MKRKDMYRIAEETADKIVRDAYGREATRKAYPGSPTLGDIEAFTPDAGRDFHWLRDMCMGALVALHGMPEDGGHHDPRGEYELKRFVEEIEGMQE